MPLKSIVAKLDDVNEAQRAFYRAGTAEEGLEGKFILDVDASDGFTLENVDGLKRALATERSEHGAAKRSLKAFEGIDPEKAKTAIAKIDELGDIDPKKDVDRLVEEKIQARVTQINERHETEKTSLSKRIEARDALLRQTLVQDAALQAISAEKGDPDLLLPHVLPKIKLDLAEGDDGKLTTKIHVLDEKGNTRIGDSQGNDMTIGQLVGDMKKHEKFSRLFEGSGHQGSGDNNPPRKPGGEGDKKLSQMSRKEKSAVINDIGLQEFQSRLRAEADASA
jgi:ribosomal protein S13